MPPLVMKGGLQLGIGEGLAGFFAFAPPGVLACPEGPQGAFHRPTGPDFIQLVAGAIAAFFADCAEGTLRFVSSLACSAGCRRPDCGQFGA